MSFKISNLKKKYQKNMLVGFIAAGLFVISISALASTWNRGNEESTASALNNPPPDSIILYPPPPKPTGPIFVIPGPPPAPPEVGKIIPVEDSLIKEVSEVPTQQQLAASAPDAPEFDPDEYASEENIEKVVRSLLPPPDVFVPYDEMPVAINQPSPDYPPLAQRAGIQGVVWLKALIDQQGKVRRVIIEKDSEAHAGFEEAAIDAAYKTTWKPALANGQPVALWVTYKVEFVLK